MKTEDYWEDAALQRELWLQENANKDLVNMLELYDKALTDIEKEIGRIKLNYQRRFGIDAETAQTYLDRQAQEQNLQRLLRQLEECETETERSKVLDFIHRDGLSTRAYSARIQRFEQLKSRIYIRMNELYKAQNAAMTETVKRVYRLAYYQTIDDTARGLNAGVSFDMLPDRAIEEVIKAPWSGRRFSASIWNNTTKLAQEAQEITARYLVTGRSLDKAAQEIAERFDVAKFRATTLVHTETSHARAAAEARVYEDLEVEEYQYLATLDHMTCERCGELDGMTFRIDEMREGVNYPVIHPRCRCTTTIAGSWGRERLARNPITGKNEKIDSSVTYAEWIKNMTEEERAAFKGAQRTYKNSAADKAQYERYKSVLGKDAPKSLDKFKAVKYNNSGAWETLKGAYRYAQQNSGADMNAYKCAKEMTENGVKGVIHIPSKPIDVSALSFDNAHINTERGHGVTEQQAKEFVEKAAMSLTVWNGQFERYYSKEGVVYVNTEISEVRTAFKKEEFNNDVKTIMEVLKKYGK